MKQAPLVIFLAALAVTSASGQNPEGFRSLFNGTDLSGWDGNPELWSVEDGAITGITTGPEQLGYNQFLIWRGGEVKNFELRARIRQSGNNSGIQYRSKELPENGKWSIGGYQCDLHPTTANNAMLYEERARGIVVQNGQSVAIDPAGKRWLTAEHSPVKVDIAEWHEYTVIANGNHLIHKIDGEVTIDLMDFDENARSLQGLLAFQIHRGPAMSVQIKDVMLKELPDGQVVPFKDYAIPSDAQVIEDGKKPGPKKKAAAPEAKAAGGENSATPISRIKAPQGFDVELLYSVPSAEFGSWVNLCADDKGRIYASDQYGGLYRFTPPAAGQQLKAEDIQKVPADIRAVNGMLFAFGALYVGVNDYEKKIPSGFYRLTDSNGDDQLDHVELLREITASGDHGVHAVVLTPDGKDFFLVCGNNSGLTETAPTSPVLPLWGDDHLLPRMPDGRGHNRSVLAPGGIIYRVSPDGKTFEIVASGFRNVFDASVNSDGDLFTYDADMEYDFNTSWYRPTRINHVVSGAEFGWRNGAGKYPEFYADTLPATLNIGPGSPTGTTFGYGAKFPSKYQSAFFVLDWSWGKIYAVHLQQSGATYSATKEEFITGAPLPVTDAIIHKDGAMYFAIGGRRVQSGLYRVTYNGSEDTKPIDLTPRTNPQRDLRLSLAALHGKQDPNAVATAWPHLSSTDRFIRSAARTVLEHQPVAEWRDKALSESDATSQLEALISLTRVASQNPQDSAMRGKILGALLARDFASLTEEQKLAYVRLIEIVLHRFGNPDDATIQAIITKLDPSYPAESFELNWLLTETLAYLQAPDTAAKGMALIAAAGSQEPQIEYARSLRFLKTGWTKELRTQQLEWFLKAENFNGGASFSKFIEFIRKDSLDTFTDAEKIELAELINKKAEKKSAIELSGAMFAGRTPTMWTLEELSDASKNGMKGRNFDNGRKMFAASACFACHRFGNEGGMTGPDLTGAGGRYSPHDLLDQIINPSKVINEQFAPIVVTLNDGDTFSGVVVNLNGDTITINTDPSDPNQRVNVNRKKVESIEISEVSQMPPGLLMMLTKDEILDLIAYVLSGGDRSKDMFQR
ncbi:MAG: DUF1080 domain-containing protein [Verrucomicrobiae bacterium]|nr:DUF1080 domain-containing protein [Verrucomicrobiae bacterium]